MGSRTWIKIYCDNWLEGTISQESLALRGIWIGLLALAGSGKRGDTGLVMAIKGVGFSDSMLAAMLKVTRQRWVYAKKTLQKTDRIAVDKANVITIINWQKYQSEYERQKPYRNPKLQQELQPKVSQEKEIEKEIEKEKEKGIRNKRTNHSEDINEIFRVMNEYLGYPDKTDRDPIPNHAKEANFMKKMLTRGFTREEIIASWKAKVAERGGEFITMVYVNDDIGKKAGRTSPGRSSTKLLQRDRYHRPRESEADYQARMRHLDARKITTDEDRRRGLA